MGWRAAAVVSALTASVVSSFAWRWRPKTEPSRRPVASTEVEQVADREPNDTAERAQPIRRLPAEVNGTLTPGDRDIFHFAVDDEGGHLLDAWNQSETGTRLRVLKEDGRELASVAAPGRIGALGLVKGGYLLSVEPLVASQGGAYRLMVRVKPWVKGLDWEPDDDAEHAQELERVASEPNQLTRYRAVGWWSHAGDIDCFRAPLMVPPAGADFRIELVAPPGVQGRVTVYDRGDPARKLAPHKLAEAATSAAGEPAVLPALGERSWESAYIICVAGVRGTNFSDRYVLEVRSFTPPGPFEFEPNDTKESASALPRQVSVHGYLTSGDVDWFRLSAGAKGKIQIALDAPAGVATVVAVRDGNGRELERVHSEAGKRVVVVAGADASFVELRAAAGGNVNQQYQLSATPVTRDTP